MFTCLSYSFFSSFLQIPDVAEDEAVRIFIEFERMESAIKGKILRLEKESYGGYTEKM